ncbi:adenylosuccinate lyase [Candidatus Aerophobetes bacterium]|nr:adenylosuccinate lyase [Candidatus Aerophobetes bacterium]
MISRYTLPKIAKIWKEEEKLAIWLKIEILVCEAWVKLGKIPEDALKEIKEKAKFDIKRVKEIEKDVKHDVIAFLTNVAEYVGPYSRYIHLGLTSSDILDTGLAMQMVSAAQIIIKDLEELMDVLKEKAREYKGTLMMGRTHGIHAEPISLGLKFALWYEETKRNLQRIKEAKEEIAYGKISGAVGTYTHLDPFIEDYVCEKLNLNPCKVSSQIIQRDRHAFYLATLAIIASSLNKFSLQIRSLQQTEIRELEEGFSKLQKGSSAMPHKRNPIICERICGLARLIRGNLQVALENIPLWGERDISHSSCERVIIPDSTILVDYILNKFINVLKNLSIYPKNMEKNIRITKGLFYSQRLLLALVEKGLFREEAYRMVQENAMRCWKENRDFKKLIKQDERIKKYLKEEEIDYIFEIGYYLRYTDEILDKVGIL